MNKPIFFIIVFCLFRSAYCIIIQPNCIIIRSNEIREVQIVRPISNVHEIPQINLNVQFNDSNNLSNSDLDEMSLENDSSSDNNNSDLDDLGSEVNRNLFASNISSDIVCPICLLNITNENEQIQACKSCKNKYHGDCIQCWLVNKATCPTCRAENSF